MGTLISADRTLIVFGQGMFGFKTPEFPTQAAHKRCGVQKGWKPMPLNRRVRVCSIFRGATLGVGKPQGRAKFSCDGSARGLRKRGNVK